MKKAEKSAFLSRRKDYMEFKMLGFSLPDISLTDRQDLMYILWFFGVIGFLYYIYRILAIIGWGEWWNKIYNNIKDVKIKFLVVAIIAIVLIYQIIPNLLETVPALLGVVTVVESLSLVCQKIIVNKFNFSKRLKENICFFRLGIFLLLAPFIFLGLFPIMKIPNGIFSPSDILGYYGSLVGGVVTVLGVYWTLNYESKKSKVERKYERQKEEKKRKRERELLKEERKENNIPVFNITIKINSESHDLDDYDYSICSENLKDEFNRIDSKLTHLELSNTNLEEEEYHLTNELELAMGKPARKIQEKLNKTQNKKTEVKQELERTLCEKNISKLSLPFSLNINNIGLQSAILYSIKYLPEGPMSSLEGLCFAQDLRYLSVPKGEVTRINIFLESYLQKKDDFITEFKEAGSFLLIYTDLYRNMYYYNVPIKIKKVEEERPSIIPTDKYKIKIDKVNLPILPKKLSEDHNEMNFFNE